jgi:dTDP-4-amino-4,6-dideoxygalactose transaminase
VGAEYATAVSSGTAALHLATLSLGIGKGDAVIVPANTFAATSNALLYCGATPIFADIDPETGNLALDSVRRCVNLARVHNLQLKAIYVVHFAGRPVDIQGIATIADEYKLVVLEDACHALGAMYRKNCAQAMQSVGAFSDVTVWSFHPAKHITTGEGGMITTSNRELDQKVKNLRSHGFLRSPALFADRELGFDSEGEANLWHYENPEIGYNYRMSEINAALGVAQLSRISENIERRRSIASFYNECFQTCSKLSVRLNADTADTLHSYHLYPILIDFEEVGISRNAFMKKLLGKGIGTQVHYIPVPMLLFYQRNPELWLADALPGAVSFFARELSIPMYFGLQDAEAQYVVEAVLGVMESRE